MSDPMPTADATRTSDAASAPDASPLDEGRFVPGAQFAGRYRIVALLGRGGMGEVYRADDLRLRQPVALKLLRPGIGRERLLQEVRLALRVTHPNVCRVHDIGEADGVTFLTMEFVAGEDLASLLRRVGRLSAERAVEVARQVCAGLAAAHERGVLHRDLKPGNVLVDARGQARLTDFGLAVESGRAGRELAGTPAYMAPEQIDGGELSTRTDLYALGLVLYELFTGRPAFRATSLAEMMEMQRSAAPTPPTRLVPDLDPRLERAILACLEKEPARRPASAIAVAASLQGTTDLDAAVAAGVTPAPADVAAGEGTALRPAAALALAAVGALAMAFGVAWNDRAMLFSQIPFDKPPDALAERARSVLSALGGTRAPADYASGFAYDRQLLQWIEEQDASPDRWANLAQGALPAVTFWYRESASPLVPGDPSGVVSPRDPPPGPGGVLVRLDTQGHVLELVVVPDALAADGAEPDFGSLLAAAGVDAQRLQPRPPSTPPPVFADRIASWDAVLASGRRARLDAAALRGRLVWLRTTFPWEVAAEPSRAVSVRGLEARALVLFVPAFLAAAGLAWRNARLGRGDPSGARRVAVFALAGTALHGLLAFSHSSAGMAEWRLLTHALGLALVAAVQAFVLYLALEPYVRRRLPSALISWTRLLQGRPLDPLVGRDLLLGAAAALTCFALSIAGHELPRWRGQPAPRLLEVDLQTLLGARHVLAKVALGMVEAVLFALVVVMVLVLLRALLRSPAAAAGAFFLFWTTVLARVWGGGRPGLEELAVYVAIAAITTFVIARQGVLATAVLALFPVLELPVTPHLGAWQAQPTFWSMAVVALVIGWGLYASLAGRAWALARLIED